MARIAINGIGSVGNLVLGGSMEQGTAGEIIRLNDRVSDPAQWVHPPEFDTVQGHWPAEFSNDADSISANRRLP